MNHRLAPLLLLVLLSSCNLLKREVWDAPAKHDTLQAQLELLGRVKPEEIVGIVAAIETALNSEQNPNPVTVKKIVSDSLPPALKQSLEVLWKSIEATVGTVAAGDADRKGKYLSAIRTALSGINDDNNLYWQAYAHQHTSGPMQSCSGCIEARCARDELIARFIVRIQDYHESNYEDVFEGAAGVGFTLDVVTTISAALAAAVTPAGTKTFWATVATIASGSRLAASKNVLNEKNSTTVLNAMMKARTEKLTALWKGMGEETKEYSVSQAKIGLVDYFNAGGLYKALAEMESATTAAKEQATVELKQARAAVVGSFSARGKSVEGKQTAVLRFGDDRAPTNLRVTVVRVEDDLVDAKGYESTVADGTLKVKFAVPLKVGVKVSITGLCSEPGPHAGVIEWE